MIKICQQEGNALTGLEKLENKPDQVCPVQQACALAKEARLLSCGKDTMCRDGLAQLYLLCESVSLGSAAPGDLELLKECCEVIVLAGGCEMSAACAGAILESLKRYPEEWAEHVGGRKRCRALACDAFCHVYVDPALCTGCGTCIAKAPEGAIEGGEGQISVIRQEEGLKGEGFLSLCPKGAIKKYSGNVIPPHPSDPVPVGSFGGGRRRRRG